MLKKLNLLLAITLVGSLVACGGSKTESKPEGKYKDGFYSAQLQADEKGWSYLIGIDVKDGKISSVDWDSVNVNTAGPSKKELSKAGKYPMVEKGGAKAEWYVQAESLEKFLVEKQDPKAITLNAEGKTDAVTGVTIGASEFVEVAEKALASQPVQKGAYKDGAYSAEGAEFDAKTGFKDTVALTVKFGNIVAASWNAVKEDGSDKLTLEAEGKYPMVENGKAIATWAEQSKTAEAELIKLQDPTKVAINAEGKTDAITNVTIHVSAFFTLAKEALDKGPQQ